ncbi:MAG: hypothetical protein GKS02_11755 [Alphaproteobacteria bacterium]|nr:hypothetical protein [Alphaproteobacteria bacterium]
MPHITLPLEAGTLAPVFDVTVGYPEGFYSGDTRPAVLNSVHMIVDTGASNTCVSKEIAAQLRLIPIGKVPFESATHTIEVERYFADLCIPIGDHPIHIRDHIVLQLPAANNKVNGLLGLDVLKKIRAKFLIDLKNETFTLET